MCIRDSLYIVDSMSAERPENIEYVKTPPEIDLLPLIVALAFDSKTALKSRLTYFTDPLNGLGGFSYTLRERSKMKRAIATPQDVQELSRLSELISNEKIENIQVATKRYISSISRRADPTDAMLDAVIGLECLFGQRSEISFAIANSVSRLLHKDHEGRLAAYLSLIHI